MIRTRIRSLSISAIVVSLIGIFVSPVMADAPPPDQYRERIPVQQDPTRDRVAAPMEDSEWMMRLSPGVTVWFFDEEDDAVGGALYLDAWNTSVPLNYRIGIEIRHLDLEQDSAAAAAEAPGRTPEITFVRIPLAVEYYTPVADNTTLFLGGGPDIINAANDLSETDVGAHLGARLHYAFTDAWGVSLEGGYMWAKFDGPGSDGSVDLSGAYVSPLLTYTF